MTILLYISIALAIARLTLIIIRDDIFQPIRHIIFLSFPPENSDRMGYYYQNYLRSTKEERNHPRLTLTVGKNWFERRWISDEAPIRNASFIGKLLSCPDCLGVWVATGYLLTYHYLPVAVIYISYVLAASMITSLIARRY